MGITWAFDGNAKWESRQQILICICPYGITGTYNNFFSPNGAHARYVRFMEISMWWLSIIFLLHPDYGLLNPQYPPTLVTLQLILRYLLTGRRERERERERDILLFLPCEDLKQLVSSCFSSLSFFSFIDHLLLSLPFLYFPILNSGFIHPGFGNPAAF